MKKLYCILIFLFPLSLFAQIDSLAGYLNDMDGPLAGETVTFINPWPEPVLVAEVITDEMGFFTTAVDSFPLDVDLQVETTVCTDLDYGVSTQDNVVLYDLYCNPPDDYPQVVIYGYPASEDNLTWNFWTTTTGEVESQTFSINDENFETDVLTYAFEESGIFSVFAATTFTNGITIYSGSDFSVGDNISDNCSASFYFMEDSTNYESGIFYLMNASIGEDLEYLWEFSDGTTSTEANPTHVFSEEQEIYGICLSITGSQGCSDTQCIEIDSGTINGFGRSSDQDSEAKDNGPTMIVLSPAFGVLSNNEILTEKSATVFPNPSDGNFEMILEVDEQDRGTLRLLDIHGRLVDQRIQALQPGSNRISYSANPATGIYILEFKGDKYHSRSRIIIE